MNGYVDQIINWLITDIEFKKTSINEKKLFEDKIIQSKYNSRINFNDRELSLFEEDTIRYKHSRSFNLYEIYNYFVSTTTIKDFDDKLLETINHTLKP